MIAIALACDAIALLSHAAAQERPRGLAVKVGATAKEAEGGRDIQRWAVIIGISRYKNGGQSIDGTTVSDLENAASDAQRIYDFLRSPEGGGFRDVSEGGRMTLLKDEQATKANVERALNGLKDARREDYFFIYIAAHGANIPVWDAAAKATMQAPQFILHDFDPRRIEETCIRMDSFQRLVRELTAQKGLVISDTCHSAGVLLPGRGLYVTTAANSRFIDQMKQVPAGVGFIASADQFEFALENDQLGGIFTHCLLEALRGNADVSEPDGVITFRETYNYVRDKVADLTGGRQHPIYNTNNLDANRIPLAVVSYPQTGVCGDPKQCGTLVVRTPDVDGVEVSVGASSLGAFNRRVERTVRLAAGEHQLSFAKGTLRRSLTARVEPGQSKIVEVNLSFSESNDAALSVTGRQTDVFLPKDKPPRKDAEKIFRDGVESFNKQQYADAIKLFNQAIRANSGAYAEAFAYRGRAEQSLNLENQAVASFTEAVKLQPSDFETRTLLAEAKFNAGYNVQEVIGELKEIIAAHPNFDYARVVYGDLLLAQSAQSPDNREQLLRNAEQQLRSAISVNPNSPPARLILANTLLFMESKAKQREAVTQAETALRLFEEVGRKKVSARKALASLSISHLIFAGARYDDEPAKAEANYILAKALTRLVDGGGGTSECDSKIDLTQQSDALRRARAPHLNEALASARKLRDKRRELQALTLSAQNYLLMGQVDSAIADGNKALALSPDSPHVHFLLYNAYKSDQKYQNAAQHLQKFIAVEVLSPQERKDYEEELAQTRRLAAAHQQK